LGLIFICMNISAQNRVAVRQWCCSLAAVLKEAPASTFSMAGLGLGTGSGGLSKDQGLRELKEWQGSCTTRNHLPVAMHNKPFQHSDA
jgi:hypothetical protein